MTFDAGKSLIVDLAASDLSIVTAAKQAAPDTNSQFAIQAQAIYNNGFGRREKPH